MILQDKIPSIYHSIFPELLSIEFPEEEIATCNACNLCRSIKSPYINTKCCTYHPHFANFLIGGVLTDDIENLALGRAIITGQIKARAGVTPYGIIPSVPYSIRQKEAEIQEFWSRPHELTESQLCPYYDNGNCTVWKYRENLCITFFCSSIGGNAGQTFWNKLNKYLKMAETSLAQYAMLELGWLPSKIKTEAVSTADFNLEDENGNVNEEKYANLWGEWIGREEDFYAKCFKIVKNIDNNIFKRITGVSREILEAAILDTQQSFMRNILPDYLILNPDIVTENTKENYTHLVLGKVSAEVPTVILPFIRGFNGKRKTADIFHFGYNVLFNMTELVNELREKHMLINV